LDITHGHQFALSIFTFATVTATGDQMGPDTPNAGKEDLAPPPLRENGGARSSLSGVNQGGDLFWPPMDDLISWPSSCSFVSGEGGESGEGNGHFTPFTDDPYRGSVLTYFYSMTESFDAETALATLIDSENSRILTRWRQQVRELPSARDLDIPTLNDHIPELLNELAEALRAKSDQTIPEALAGGSSPIHGLQRLKDTFDIEEVVAEYNLLRGCIHYLADIHEITLTGGPLHIINRVFDRAIGLALQAYSTQRSLEIRRRREEYLAFVAHDLRTPLSAISLAGRVLQETLGKDGSDATSARILNVLRRSVQQLEHLVTKVLEENTNLETETGMKLHRRQFDLWSLVESLIYDLHPVAGTASTRLINEVPDGLYVYADASLLRRLVQNLIANAIRYTPRGEIIIGARESDAAGGTECWVTDNGSGIPEAFLEKVFIKGETDSEDEGGMGLGLAIVKTVAEAHGGKVTAESRKGEGTTFRFSLPGKSDGHPN
jgi:signal transduction histidine kinase